LVDYIIKDIALELASLLKFPAYVIAIWILTIDTKPLKHLYQVLPIIIIGCASWYRAKACFSPPYIINKKNTLADKNVKD
jgi:hypothetical protein